MEEANELSHNYIGTEHLLLGLLRENDGVAARVLLDLGLELEEARNEVLELVGMGAEAVRKTGRGLPSPKFVPPISQAREEASRLGHGFVGTGHLLLALLAEDGGKARRLLEELGVGLDRVRAEKEKLAQYDLATVAEEDVPASPLLRGLIRRSIALAGRLGRPEFDSRHLLLALVAEEDSYEARLLARLGVDLGEARRRAIEALGITPEKVPRLLSGEEETTGSGILELLRRLFRPKSE
jgi:ATP-dependent Clp protease ATP-binding subunit ClpA